MERVEKLGYKEAGQGQLARRKRKKKKSSSGFFSKVLLVLLFVIAIVLATKVINSYTRIAQLQDQIDVIGEEISQLESQRDELALDLEPYKATARIEKIAKLELGLDYPRQDQIVEIDVSQSPSVEELVEEDKSIMGNIISRIRSGE